MNRKDRRSLDNSKGGLDARAERIRRAEANLQSRIDTFERTLLEQSKSFASMTIQKELLPIVVATVKEVFDPPTEEAIIKFEATFTDLFQTRLKEIKSIGEILPDATEEDVAAMEN